MYLEESLAHSGLSTNTWMNKWTPWSRWFLQLQSSWTPNIQSLGPKRSLWEDHQENFLEEVVRLGRSLRDGKEE